MDEKRTTSVDGEISDIVRQIYELVGRLERLYPGRHFTPDGHMVGSLGEVFAAEQYGLELFEASHPVHDAKDQHERLVQIKATQGDRVALSEEPNFLIVLRINKDGGFEEVYNGPGKPAWDACGKLQKTGQRHVSLSKLKEIANCVPAGERIREKENMGGCLMVQTI